MIIKNVKIVKNNEIIDNGYIEIQDKLIVNIAEGNYEGSDINVVDGNNKIAMPGFIDLHTHGGYGVDFMEANEEQINYQNGTMWINTFLVKKIWVFTGFKYDIFLEVIWWIWYTRCMFKFRGEKYDYKTKSAYSYYLCWR